MSGEIENWKTQIKKGYLELCLLLTIQRMKRVYGLELIEALTQAGLPTKEGTLYPILNRLTADGVLQSAWETEGSKGHPRKFYSLTNAGSKSIQEMSVEFERMILIFQKSKNE